MTLISQDMSFQKGMFDVKRYGNNLLFYSIGGEIIASVKCSSGGGGGDVVLQPTTGQSEEDGMTQKAITDELNKKSTREQLALLQSRVAALETLLSSYFDVTLAITDGTTNNSFSVLAKPTI